MSLGPTDAWAQAANNVDCNKCVDTDDIAKKAVDKKKLAKGAVDSSRIADGAVKAKDLADGAVEESKLAAGAVTDSKLVDGAVAGDKLVLDAVDSSKLAAGAVSSSKLVDGAVTGDKLAADAIFGAILVRADPLDTTGNCDALQDALAGITDNSADNPYTILLVPGIYDCGSTPVQMKPFVDLQGSGRGVTEITGSLSGDTTGVVRGADDAELRRLSVENANAVTGVAVAIFTDNDRFKISDVSAVARDSEEVIAILVSDGDAVLTDVTAEVRDATADSANAIQVSPASGRAVLDNVETATDSSANQNVGLAFTGGVIARNSVFRGADAALNVGSAGVGRFISTQLDAGFAGSGNLTCVNSYGQSFDLLLGNCAAI